MMSRSMILVAVLALSGCGVCITRDEYRDFVQAAERYRAAVGPDYLRRLDQDPAVPEQVRKNRHALDLEFGDAVAAATSRVGAATEE